MSDQFNYPKGRIAMDNGDLMDVTNVTHVITNNGKQIHTLRRKGAGTTLGVEESTITFDAVVSEEGAERDYMGLVKSGAAKQIRIKVPNETITVNGIATERSLEVPLDDAVKYSINFVGKTDD